MIAFGIALYTSISGSMKGEVVFTNVADVIGGTSPIPDLNVRDALKALNPRKLIIELPGGEDMGTVPIEVCIPAEISCPEGTTPVIDDVGVSPP